MCNFYERVTLSVFCPLESPSDTAEQVSTDKAAENDVPILIPRDALTPEEEEEEDSSMTQPTTATSTLAQLSHCSPTELPPSSGSEHRLQCLESSGSVVSSLNGITTPKPKWLGCVLLPKVVQWAEESVASHVARRQPLVSLGRYSCLYRELKDKYGPSLVKVRH